MSRDSSDLRLREDVIEELDWEPRIDAAHIGVSARGGIVTLSGHVENYGEKLAAALAARRVKGVRALAVEIEVHPPAAKKTADDEIAARALRMLEWDVVVPSDRITVTVDHGIVTLAGQVEWRYQREEAEADLRKLSGVRDIVNTITVKPHAKAEDVRERILRAFERNAEMEAHRIEVAVEGSRAVLTGRVGSWIERQEAERAAWAAPGVAVVENRIEIGHA